MDLIGNVQLVAGNASALEGIFEALRKIGIKPRGNPDVYVREYTSFGVDEARELAARAGSRAIASRRVFIAVAPLMTTEAQNALLKTLEEPPGDALFFFVVPSPNMLLPTLRSRAQTFSLGGNENELSVDPERFLRAKPEARVSMLKPLLEKDEDDKRDTAGAIAFLSALERLLAQDVRAHREGLAAVYRARKYIGDKGASTKALLEQVAFLVG